MLSTSELRISLWPVTGSSIEQFVDHIQALTPTAQVDVGFTQNEIRVYLEGESQTAVAALEVLLRGEIDTLVYSYRWYHVN